MGVNHTNYQERGGVSPEALLAVQPTPTATGNTTNLNTIFKDAAGVAWFVDAIGNAQSLDAPPKDFWSSNNGTLLPDGTTDATDSIGRLGSVGVGLVSPTSTLHTNGSSAGSITNVTVPTTLSAVHHKVLVSNGTANITITFPNALTCLGREYVLSRAAGSTGSITLTCPAGNRIQALVGTTGATSTIGVHTAAGGGLNHRFTAINFAGVGFWVRI